jgi:hypothetical protein
MAPPQPINIRPNNSLPHPPRDAVDKVDVRGRVLKDLTPTTSVSQRPSIDPPNKKNRKERKKKLTLLISSPPTPNATSRALKLPRNTSCRTAPDKGRPSVTPTEVERYMKEMAGARWAGLVMAAWSETNTADWATPVPRPLGYLLVGELVGGSEMDGKERGKGKGKGKGEKGAAGDQTDLGKI